MFTLRYAEIDLFITLVSLVSSFLPSSLIFYNRACFFFA